MVGAFTLAATAGRFTIVAKDAFANVRYGRADTFEVRLAAATQPPTASPLGDGTYEVSYRAAAAPTAATLTVVALRCGGLIGTYHRRPTLDFAVGQRVDAAISFSWRVGEPPLPGTLPHQFAVQWSGVLRVLTTGTYALRVEAYGRVRLWLAERLLVDQWSSADGAYTTPSLPLQIEATYAVRLDYSYGELAAPTRPAQVSLAWLVDGLGLAISSAHLCYDELGLVGGVSRVAVQS